MENYQAYNLDGENVPEPIDLELELLGQDIDEALNLIFNTDIDALTPVHFN